MNYDLILTLSVEFRFVRTKLQYCNFVSLNFCVNTHILTSYLQKGLVYFSIPTVVMGPWAGNTIVSSGKEKMCLRI